MIESRLLGFDAREAEDARDLWDEQRRITFLLRLDVARPLSVDTMVWPSLFDSGQGLFLPAGERERLRLAGLPLPRWIGPHAGLWQNLAAMRQYLAAQRLPTRRHALIAVSWFSDAGFQAAGEVGPYGEPTSPPQPGDGWQFLGLDVADGSLLSGLTNCGYSAAEAVSLRSQWAHRLNARHLFDDPAAAFTFRALANARVPEHAPFFVYGLYLLDAPKIP